MEPPVTNPGDLFQKIGLKVDHPVAPAVGGFGFTGVQFIGVHGGNGVGRRYVLRATIAKTLGTGFNRANAESFMGVRLKRITGDVRMIQFNAWHLCQMAKAGTVFLIKKLLRYTLHVISPHASSCHYQRRCVRMPPQLTDF